MATMGMGCAKLASHISALQKNDMGKSPFRKHLIKCSAHGSGSVHQLGPATASESSLAVLAHSDHSVMLITQAERHDSISQDPPRLC